MQRACNVPRQILGRRQTNMRGARVTAPKPFPFGRSRSRAAEAPRRQQWRGAKSVVCGNLLTKINDEISTRAHSADSSTARVHNDGSSAVSSERSALAHGILVARLELRPASDRRAPKSTDYENPLILVDLLAAKRLHTRVFVCAASE